MVFGKMWKSHPINESRSGEWVKVGNRNCWIVYPYNQRAMACCMKYTYRSLNLMDCLASVVNDFILFNEPEFISLAAEYN